MKKLIIYDHTLKLDRLSKTIWSGNDEVYLFPLTSQESLTEALKEEIGSSVKSLKVILTAQQINVSAEQIRARYLRFIAELPEKVRRENKNLKEIFALDEEASLWWFSQIAEKNTYKSEAFNRLAQLDAIVQTSIREKITELIVATESVRLNLCLKDFCARKSLACRLLPGAWRSWRKLRMKDLQAFFYLKHLFHLLCFSLWFAFLSFRIKQMLPSVKRQPPVDSLMLVTSYPSLDVEKARKGVFQNNFYACLQDALQTEDKKVVWVAFFVKNNTISFKDSLQYARQFIMNGQHIYFLEEFNSLQIQWRAWISILQQGPKFLKLQKLIATEHQFDHYNFFPLFRDDWYSSFCGTTGYFGIIFYQLFQSVFKNVPAKKCLYFWEMQSWEKALVLAKQTAAPAKPVYGYQSTSLSRMVLNYFNHPEELRQTGRYPIPQPNRLICNGTLPYHDLKEGGWASDRLLIAEATRYRYLRDYLEMSLPRKDNVVLLACSISPEESASLLRILSEAFKEKVNYKIWVKPHPFLPVDKLFAAAGISADRFEIKTEPISQLLLQSKAIVVGESGVSLEAIALGCKVIMVNVPEWINMSPLRRVKSELVRPVSSPEELKRVVGQIMNETGSDLQQAEAIRILDDFFCLEFVGKKPVRFLELLDV